MEENKKSNLPALSSSHQLIKRTSSFLSIINQIIPSKEWDKWWNDLNDNWKTLIGSHVALMEKGIKFEDIINLTDDIQNQEYWISLGESEGKRCHSATNVYHHYLNESYFLEKHVFDLKKLNDLNFLVIDKNFISKFKPYGYPLDSDYSPLKMMSNIKFIQCMDNSYASLENHLKDFKSLEHLDFQSSDLRNLSFVEDLPNLRFLHVGSTGISDISPLKYLLKLEALALGHNCVLNYEPLKHLTNLKRLDCWGAKIDNDILNTFPYLNHLEFLNLKGMEHMVDSRFSDISPLSKFTSLKELFLSKNQLSHIGPLQNLNLLENLDLSKNQIFDIKAVKNLDKLKKLKLNNNQISEIEPLQNLNMLENLDLSNNKLSDINALKNLNRLEILYLSGNNISDLSPLHNLKNLKVCNFYYNNVQSNNLEYIKTKLPNCKFYG